MTNTTMQLLSQSTDPVKMPDFDILAEGGNAVRRGRAPDESVTDRQPGI